MKKRFTQAQIIRFLKEADTGVSVKELCRRHGFSKASYYPAPKHPWRRSFKPQSADPWTLEPKRGHLYLAQEGDISILR